MYSKGLIPRDFKTHPVGYCCPAFGDHFQPLPDSEIDDRIEALEKNQATLLDLRNMSGPNGGRIPSTDQDGIGYCWAHSTVSAMLLLRAKQGLPYVELNAFGPAAVIKNGRDEGGWCQQSMKFVAEHGCPTTKTWKFQSRDTRQWDADAKAEAALYRVTEWYDGGDDPRLFWTAISLGFPIASDWNSWGHSVCTAHGNRRTGEVLIWNSWGDQWKTNGVGRPDARERTASNWMVPRIVTA